MKRGYGKLKKGFKVLHRGHEEMREAVLLTKDCIVQLMVFEEGRRGSRSYVTVMLSKTMLAKQNHTSKFRQPKEPPTTSS